MIGIGISPMFQDGAGLNLLFMNNSAFSVAENSTDVARLISNTQGVVFSIVPDGDGSKFIINGCYLKFDTSQFSATFGTPDFSNPLDSNVDNTYAVTVRQTKGSTTKDQIINVTVTDLAANLEVVKIGNQQWSKINFNETQTVLGTPIDEVTVDGTWTAATTPAWCKYNNNAANKAIYGVILNWYAISKLQADIDTYNAANPTTPYKFRCPEISDFNIVQEILGGATVAGGKLKEAATTHWSAPNTSGSNSSGFASLPNGFRSSISGGFGDLAVTGQMWTLDKYRVYPSYDTAVLTQQDMSGYLKWGCALRMIKSYKTLIGKKIVCFGDSITELGYPAKVATRTGATVTSLGIGGTQLSRNSVNTLMQGLSMASISDAIKLNDWSTVIAAANDINTSLGWDFRFVVNQMAAVNYAGTDVISIFFGTNDFGGSRVLGVITDTEPTTFFGAINYVINNIRSTYPTKNIIFYTPIWRKASGNDSDTVPNAVGSYLLDYVDALKAVGNKNSIPVVDLYRTSGINDTTKAVYLNTDMLHPIALGTYLLGEIMSKELQIFK